MTHNTTKIGSIWIVTDGKAGDLSLCRAIANRLEVTLEERVIKPRAPYSWFMPDGPCDPKEAPGVSSGPLAGPLPAGIIATGRRTVPYLRALKSCEPRLKTFFLKNPRTKRNGADFIWAPKHDGMSGPGVFETLLAPHSVTANALTLAKEALRPEISQLPSPRLGIILGGPSNGTRYDRDTLNSLVSRINAASKTAASVLVTPSRRTPPEFIVRVRDALKSVPNFIWDGEGQNPYHEILAASNALIVTADSHNMMSETLAVGVQTHIFRPYRLDRKLERCLNAILMNKWALPFDGQVHFRQTEPIDETSSIADAIVNAIR